MLFTQFRTFRWFFPSRLPNRVRRYNGFGLKREYEAAGVFPWVVGHIVAFRPAKGDIFLKRLQ